MKIYTRTVDTTAKRIIVRTRVLSSLFIHLHIHSMCACVKFQCYQYNLFLIVIVTNYVEIPNSQMIYKQNYVNKRMVQLQQTVHLYVKCQAISQNRFDYARFQ